MIQFKNVSFSYEKETSVLDDISFTINSGESVGLIGANGAGKSTLMNIIPGLLAYEGEVLVDQILVDKKNLQETRRKIGFVLQNSDAQMFMPTVYDDIMFAPLNYGVPREAAEQKAEEVLTALDLLELKKRHNHKLSGGEKRMAAIATVLAMEPSVLLMDEPTAALDPYNRRKVIEVIQSLKQTKLIASHDLDMVLDTCERVILLARGRIVADGPADTILKNRELLEQHRMELPLRYQR